MKNCTVYVTRLCWIKSLFWRKWRRQCTNAGGRGREENLPLLFPAAVLARPLQAHQGHAQVWCRSDWTEKVLLCSHTLLFFCSSKANADMVVCKYCMKTFRNNNSLGWNEISAIIRLYENIRICSLCLTIVTSSVYNFFHFPIFMDVFEQTRGNVCFLQIHEILFIV